MLLVWRLLNDELSFSVYFCGFVCLVAQLIYEYTKLTPGHITSMFVVIGAFLIYFIFMIN